MVMSNFPVPTFILGIFLLCERSQSILDADYFIQSKGLPKLCIESGDVDKNYGGVLFQMGIMQTNPCKNVAEQNWHFKQLHQSKNESKHGPLYYNISSSASETIYSPSLYANVTGFFTTYWINPVQIVKLDKEKGINGTEVIIKDTHNGTCFESFGDGKEVKSSKCKDNYANQIWTLSLVTMGNVSLASLPTSPYLPASTQ